MSKFLARLCFSTAILGLATVTNAQLPPASQTPQPTPSIAPSPTPTTPPATATPDIKLFSRAVEIFWRTKRAQTESQIEIDGKNTQTPNLNFRGYATVKTIAQTGYKFRSEIKVAQAAGSPQTAYTVVCDGKQVWIYRPDKRQYAQTNLNDFQRQSYSYAIGLSSIFFVSMDEKERQEVAASLAANRNEPLALSKESLKDLNGSLQKINGQDLYVYSYENKQEKIGFVGYVQPQTAVIKQVSFTGLASGTELTINEKIVNRISLNDSNPDVFRFSPPQGAKKVNSLAIEFV